MGIMSTAEYREYLRKKKTPKYGQQRVDGFPSKLERAVYKILKLREQAGELRDLKRYDKVEFPEALTSWSIDFWAIDVKTDSPVWIEAKGKKCDKWKHFERCWKKYGPGPLVLYQGDYKNPVECRPIIPKGE